MIFVPPHFFQDAGRLRPCFNSGRTRPCVIPPSAVLVFAEIRAGNIELLYIGNRCFMSAVDITVLLALSVYQLIVSDSLPVTSLSVPVFG